MKSNRNISCNGNIDLTYGYVGCKVVAISDQLTRTVLLLHIVAYLFKAKTVDAEKQLLLRNGPYTRSRGMRHVRRDVTQ
jgi:hypothetical protein